jgi:hypothetical protein
MQGETSSSDSLNPHPTNAPAESQSPDAIRGCSTGPLSETVQGGKDAQEKSRHSATENALGSAQDKNPIPAGSRRSRD